MQFNNTENKCLELKDGGKIWKSRNVAVVVVILHGDQFFSDEVYLVKRGRDMTHSNTWCFPCGYLDWDETVQEAAIREVYEETGLIANIKDLKFVGIDSDPSKFSQNVSIRFLLENGKDLVKDPNHKIDLGEVSDSGWFSIQKPLPDMAFDHKEICEEMHKTLKHNMGL